LDTEILFAINLQGDGFIRLAASAKTVIPAKAGIQFLDQLRQYKFSEAAFAPSRTFKFIIEYQNLQDK
jgi:hypothetical protein